MAKNDTVMISDAAAALEHAEQIRMLQVFTVSQKPDERSEQVTASTRSTKENPVADADKARFILIPALEVSGVPSKYESMLLDALRETAKEQLQSIWKDNPQVREVPAAIWNVDSLLLFAARVAESKRLSKTGIQEWLNGSDLMARLMAKGAPKVLKDWSDRLLAMAGPCSLDEKNCNSMIATIKKNAGDAEHIIGAQIIARCESRLLALTQSAAQLEEV